MYPHVNWLRTTTDKLETSDGLPITVLELVVDNTDHVTWETWAKHFREHYCLDSRIDEFREGTSLDRAEYLLQLVFPDAIERPGPSIRSGDFTEILIADILEAQFKCWVPRTRYAGRAIRNESTKGTDVLGFTFENVDFSPSPDDELLAVETKAQLTGKRPKPRLQDAVKDSGKDALRKGESLNAMKQRLLLENRRKAAQKVQRFQDKLDRPYIERSGAAAFFCSALFDAEQVQDTRCENHPNTENLFLIVVHAKDFMALVHALYERAANEA